MSSTLCSDVSPTVGPSGVSGPLGYIRVATFNGKTAEAFREALISLKVSSASSWEECVWGRVAEGGLLNRSARHGNVGRVLVEGDGAGIFDTIPRTLARPLPFQKQGAERFVLDIRNNGGGLFPAGALAPLHCTGDQEGPKIYQCPPSSPPSPPGSIGVQVARSLINSGDIVLIADANGVRDIYSADGLALDTASPLSVLVNKGTASASEVRTGSPRRCGIAVKSPRNGFELCAGTPSPHVGPGWGPEG